MKNKFAGFWERQLALLLDALIIGAPTSMIASMFLFPAIYGPELFEQYKAPDATFFVEFYKKAVYLQLGLFCVLAAVMAAFTASGWQATPGKKIIGIKVIKVNGARVKFGEAFLRYISLPLVMLTVQAPERYIVYQKLGGVNLSTVKSLEDFVQIVASPISFYTEIITILLSVYWVVRISFSKENTALHDLLFDTRVVKA